MNRLFALLHHLCTMRCSALLHLHITSSESTALSTVKHWRLHFHVPNKYSSSISNEVNSAMSLPKAAAFNWELAMSRSVGVGLEGLQRLKMKSAELTMKTDKFVKPREPIDFAAYKSKLTLTRSGFEYLEKLYKEDNIPKFYAKIPELTLQKRAACSIVFKEIAIHAQEDIELIKQEIVDLGPKRITMDTTYNQMCERYPQFARQIEAEIDMHMYCYNHDAAQM